MPFDPGECRERLGGLRHFVVDRNSEARDKQLRLGLGQARAARDDRAPEDPRPDAHKA